MCLYTKKFRTRTKLEAMVLSTPKIAMKDITIFKIFTHCTKEDFWAPYRQYVYTPGSKHTSTLDQTLLSDEDNRGKFYYGIVNQGIHGYRTKAKARKMRDPGERIFKCTIPKGAKYIIGTNSEIVTTQLIIGTWKDLVPSR